MSRRRCTTAKMFSGNRQRGPKRTSQSRPSVPTATGRQDDSEPPAHKSEPLTTDTLSRHLAAEALLRESSERRMASTIKRYFRLTVALVGINALVAGSTMIVLWARAGRGPEVVVVPNGPAPQPQPRIVASPAPAPVPVAAPAPAAPVPAVSPAPSGKREALAPLPRPRRPAVRIQVAHRPAEEAETVALDGIVERW